VDSALDQKVELLRREVDGLQATVMGGSKPWYRNTSTILSVVALLFSFSTTFVSYNRTRVQDIQNSRAELRGLLQRLSALPKENVEARRKYADDPGALNLVGGFINQENALLARQAAQIARKLPPNTVSGVEYYAVAIALGNSYDLNTEGEFLRYSAAAAEQAKDFNTEIAVARTYAALQFQQGRPDMGRIEYEKASNIFGKYPGYDAYTKASTTIWTELAWATSEASVGAFDQSRRHVQSAKAVVDTLPPGPGTAMLSAQVAQAQVQLSGGQPVAATITPPPIELPQSLNDPAWGDQSAN